jgi:hypothetical protein
MILAFLLLPILIGSYTLGPTLRRLYPGSDVLRPINRKMLFLLPIFTMGRLLLQSSPPKRVTTYLTLPIKEKGLLRGKLMLSFISLHTALALVMVMPLWVVVVWPVLTTAQAFGWLGAALLVAIVGPSFGTELLQTLGGKRPRWFAGALIAGTGIIAADVAMGPDLFQTVSGLLFSSPLVGLGATLTVAGGTYKGLLHLMQTRLEIDRRAERDKHFNWDQVIYQSIEHWLPAGRLIALELRQAFRTRRLQSVILYTTFLVAGIHAWGFTTNIFPKGPVSTLHLVLVSTTGIGGCTIGMGHLILGISADYADGLLSQPIKLKNIVRGKLTILWLSTAPGTVLLLATCGWMALRESLFFIASVFWWWGIIVPALIWINMGIRNPVDLSASHFSLHSNFYSMATIFISLSPLIACVIVKGSNQWWIVTACMALFGLAGIFILLHTVAPFTGELAENRIEMLEGFRKNPPI